MVGIAGAFDTMSSRTRNYAKPRSLGEKNSDHDENEDRVGKGSLNVVQRKKW